MRKYLVTSLLPLVAVFALFVSGGVAYAANSSCGTCQGGYLPQNYTGEYDNVYPMEPTATEDANYFNDCVSACQNEGTTLDQQGQCETGTIKVSGTPYCYCNFYVNGSSYNTNTCAATGGCNNGNYAFYCTSACTISGCVSNYNSSCTSSANACGGTNTGTILCNGSCSASAPANPSGYGNSCTSSANSCGMTNSGTIGCSGSCSATTPANSLCTPGTPTGLTATPSNSCSKSSGVAQVSFTGNRYGIDASGTATPGTGFDGQNYAYASALLGSSLTWNGNTYSFGSADTQNAVTNSTITLPSGNYTTLSLLGAATGNQTAQTLTVTYTDNTTSTFTQSFSNWCSSPQGYSGESTALSTSYRIQPNGTTQSLSCYVYGYSFALNSAKTVKSLTLPNNTSVVILSIDLSGGSTSNNTATTNLAWNASSNATSYTLQDNGTTIYNGSNTSYSQTGLTPGSSHSYTVAASDSGGTSSYSSAVGSTASSCSASCSTLSATPSSVNSGGTVTLTWSCQNASSCTEIANSDGFSTGGSVSGSDTATPKSSGTTTYGMTCGSTSIYFPPVTVTTPSVSISASPTRVQPGGSSTVAWYASNVNSCTVSENGTQLSSLKIATTTLAISTQTTFTITCTTSGSPVSASTIVNVVPDLQEF